MKNNIIIIGGLHHNTLGVVRAFGEKGFSKNNIFVILTGKELPQKNIISSSKYVKSVVRLDSEKELSGYLVENQSLIGGGVIVCCSDSSATEIIRSNEKLKEYYRTPNTIENVDELMRKDVQSRIAQESGLNIPLSKVINSREKADWKIFPCITKPLRSTAGAGKSDINISQTPEELTKVLAETKAEEVQIQQYLTKTMEFQLIGCSLDRGEKIIIPGFTNIIRQPKNTNTGYLKYSPISGLNFDMESLYRFIRRIGYSGLFSMEFLRCSDGKDYFMEINMRNDGNAYCVTKAGVNLPYIWYYYNAFKQLPTDEPLSFEKPVYFIPDLSDIKLGIKEIGIFGWLKQFFDAEAHSVYNAKDFKPFITALRQFLLRHVKHNHK